MPKLWLYRLPTFSGEWKKMGGGGKMDLLEMRIQRNRANVETWEH